MPPRLALTASLLLALLTPRATAQSLDLPPRKPGLWETRMVTEQPAGGPTITTQMCVDAATDRELMEFGLKMSKGRCQRFDVKRHGAAWVIDADCAFGPVKSVTKTTITGDFQSSMTVRIEGTTEGFPGAGSGPQPTLMTQTATWRGATCTDGMKPGDVSLGNGITMNVRQLRRLQRMLPKLEIR